MKERESQLQKEDLSDMVAEHAAKQKVSVARGLMHDFVTLSNFTSKSRLREIFLNSLVPSCSYEGILFIFAAL